MAPGRFVCKAETLQSFQNNKFEHLTTLGRRDSSCSISGSHRLTLAFAVALQKVFLELDNELGQLRPSTRRLSSILRVRSEMDPLSITAGILAVTGAGSTIGKGLKKILFARREPLLFQLNNEVTDLHFVVQGVRDLLQQSTQTNRDNKGFISTRASLVSALEHVKETLLALESLIAYRLTSINSRDGRTKVDRITWLQVEPEVKSIKDDIRTDRVRLSTALGLFAA